MLTVDLLLRAGEVDGLDTAGLLLQRRHSRASGDGGGPDTVEGRDEGTSLDGRRGQLTGQWRAGGPGEASGGHDDAELSGDAHCFGGWGMVFGERGSL